MPTMTPGQLDGMEPNAPDNPYIEPVFVKMEKLIREMQHPETGVPVRSQKLFLTSIPCAFVGYDVVEWLMDNLDIEDQNPVAAEALHLANLLCQHGYFFPVGDNAKTYTIKDDSTLYRFQSPYFWPSRYQPDNTDYAVYLVKRSLKNKQKYALEEYEQEALQRLKKLLYHKWEFISMQAEEQVTLAKERKKTDRMILNSQERAFWRIHRPPPGCTSCLEKSPVPNKRVPPKKKTKDDLKRELEFLKRNVGRTRTKVSQVVQSLINRCEEYKEFDPFIPSTLPNNPWITDDPTLWTLNNTLVETPTEKRVKRWAISLEELLADPQGVHEFEIYLRKEYSHENILFWQAVQDLKHGSQQNVAKKVNDIYEEFLAEGAPCEVNLDSQTIETTQDSLRKPSRFTFDAAQQHVFALMMKDTYPRFVRSEHYRNLLLNASTQQMSGGHRKRFFHFGSSTKKKSTSERIQHQPKDQQSGRPLSGSTVDLRNSIQRRERDSDGSRTFSGRHSHSTSDLHKLDAPSAEKPTSSRLSSPSGSRDFMNEAVAGGTTLQVPRWSHRASDPGSMASQEYHLSLAVPNSRVAPWETDDEQHNSA